MKSSIDLDPATAGKQTTRSVTGGTFVANTDGTVGFTPNTGFVGRAQASYVVKDNKHRRSNEAGITVQVLPDPTAAIQLFTFETGTEGWASTGGTGTISQAAAFSATVARPASRSTSQQMERSVATWPRSLT